MASSPSISIAFFFFFFFVISSMFGFVQAQKKVPAFYVIGDSLMDVGNNNYLVTILRADFAHNGIDFAGGKATGRFTNGKNAADFFAEELGLPSPPPYLAIRWSLKQAEAFFDGISFASGGAGVLSKTNENLCISLSKQMDYLTRVYEAISKTVGEDEAQRHLSKSIFAVNIGSNDIFGYFNLFIKPTPQQYADSMISSLREHLKTIYNLGARKLLFIGLGPVGCCPYQRNGEGECNEIANHLANIYNQGASSLLKEMKSTLPNLNYSFFNTTLAVLELIQNSANYGFTDVKGGCCGVGGNLNLSTPCTPFSRYCGNRKDYIFWDFAHPTEATVQFTTNIAVAGSKPYVYPMNMRQLIRV